MTHTATPWIIDELPQMPSWEPEKLPAQPFYEISDGIKSVIAVLYFDQDERRDHYDNAKANADFIVTAVNSHEDLLEALNNLGDGVTDMFEQLTRGNWVDDHGHSVLLNRQMIALENNIQEAQAAIKSARGQK